jgi:hypothetical protein
VRPACGYGGVTSWGSKEGALFRPSLARANSLSTANIWSERGTAREALAELTARGCGCWLGEPGEGPPRTRT